MFNILFSDVFKITPTFYARYSIPAYCVNYNLFDNN
jgi:hypothetical protein